MTDEEKNIALQITKVSERIKHIRIEKGYSSYENFALEKEISRMQYWRTENSSNITLKTLFKTLHLLEISPEDFFKDFS